MWIAIDISCFQISSQYPDRVSGTAINDVWSLTLSPNCHYCLSAQKSPKVFHGTTKYMFEGPHIYPFVVRPPLRIICWTKPYPSEALQPPHPHARVGNICVNKIEYLRQRSKAVYMCSMG